jgi:predicted PurR-regulated permease PerM
MNIGININDLEFDVNKLVEYVPSIIIGLFKGCFKYIGSIFIGLVIGLYMSMEYDKIINFLMRIIPKKYKCEVVGILDKISVEVRKCITGMLLVSFTVFLLDTIAFLILKLNSPILLGVLCGITDLIPYIGPYIGGGIAILVALSEGKGVIIATLIFIVIIQLIENYVLQPIIMSKSVKISPLLIIIGLLVFGNLFGIVGMLLSTPLVCIIRVIYLYIDEVREKCKKKKKFDI